MNNLYLLVEGRRTEAKLYPMWVQWLLKGFTEVKQADQAVINHFYLISGGGYPQLLDVTLPDAVEELNALPQFKHLFICLDSDELSALERRTEVQACLEDLPLKFAQAQIIVQHRCIETWLLGNQNICPNQPANDADCIRYLQHYRVDRQDPEAMPLVMGERIHAQFHERFLKAIFRERNPHASYHKHNPGQAAELHYFQALLSRLQNKPGQLASFAHFVQSCQSIPVMSPPEAA